jgi:hypothetical protein
MPFDVYLDRAYLIYDYRRTYRWFPAPVLAGKGKQPVFDLIPFAFPRRKARNGCFLVRPVCRFLKFHLPRIDLVSVVTANRR